jgi:hypothetical protein
MGLGSKVFQKQGIHGALEADMKLADVAVPVRTQIKSAHIGDAIHPGPDGRICDQRPR